jgi:acetyl/propionyl-CoA carboxylase alpha subunit/acetyl-CoA carboxylase carboxyltransferase component
MKLLVANRGEIAIRILRAAAELGIATVAVFSKDDARCLHTGKADEAVDLQGIGAAAYQDIDQIISVAKQSGCDAVHPGCGFLAENAEFAQRCVAAGLTFVGPSVDTLTLFGDKAGARVAATAAGVPVIQGLDHPVSLAEATAFYDVLDTGRGMIIKAIAGAGGRGTRVVTSADELEDTFERCRAEAEAAFGDGDVYVEELVPSAHHVEVQILGDLHGAVTHLGERDCSIQRNFQKIVQVAPAPGLPIALREQIIDAAMRLADSVSYANAGTFEFLVDATGLGNEPFAFIEANARLEVEHTITEAVTGVDIVQAQIRLAEGASIAELGLDHDRVAEPRGFAIQTCVCMETIHDDGSVHPSAGTLAVYEVPSGPGVRTDGFGYSGYSTSLSFDSLLAKVIGHSSSPNLADAIARTTRALSEFRIEGVDTNIPFLQGILAHQDFAAGSVHTRFVDEQIAELTASSDSQRRFVEPIGGAPVVRPTGTGASSQSADHSESAVGPEGSIGLVSPMQGTIVHVEVAVGDQVRVGQLVAVVEAMKLQHDIKADRSGIVCAVPMSVGDVVREGHPVVFINEMEVEGDAFEADETLDPDHIRGDLQEMLDRRVRAFDEFRPDAVTERHEGGRRTARENIADLVDKDSFREFGPLAAGQTAGGLVMGVGSVNADRFDDEQSRVIVVHYDAMTQTGTRHTLGEYKQDRIYELAHRYRVPLVLFSEGSGKTGNYGRKGGARVNIDTTMFAEFAKLSGLVPLVGMNTGDCFDGNAALLACCDVIIATQNSTIGMGRPDMVEAGGRAHAPEDVGPMSFQVPNGVVDILVADDAAAVEVSKKYLSYFQGTIDQWETPDQRHMRHIIPEDRVRTYDVREIIDTLADEGSILEVRKEFGIGIITSLIRIEGRPMGLVANNPVHLAGAIDSDGADKGTRFLQLCDAFDLPVITMMDCPGIMVGPAHEREALVRHCTRMFNTGANLTTPMFGVVIRKAYGLGVQAMCGASSLVPFFTVAWPTAEFAGMNIDGGVKLSSRRELMAIEDPEERKAAYDRKVAQAYEGARAVNSGGNAYGIDDIIDPADTRAWIVRGLKSLPPLPVRTEKKRPYIDTW